MGTTLRVLLGDGVTLRGVGLEDVSPDSFYLRTTEPRPENSGILPYMESALEPYDPTGLLRSITVTNPGETFVNVDFGNVRVVVRTSGVRFIRCRWVVTDNDTTSPMVNTDNAGASGVYMEQCTVDNRDQGGYSFNAVQGHDITMYRCKFVGTVDGIRPNLGGNVKIHGCFIGFLGWWGSYEGGPYLNTINQTHSDGIQTMYGGVEMIGSSIWAYPSTVVGTGTPGSGSDTGNTGHWYTQAEAEARRAASFTSMTNPAKSADGVAHEKGGIVTAFMANRATGPTNLNLVIEDNWFAGGLLHVNALAEYLTTSLGSFKRNKHYNDTHYTVGGRSMGYRLLTGLGATIPQTGLDVNTYVDSGSVVPVD